MKRTHKSQVQQQTVPDKQAAMAKLSYATIEIGAEVKACKYFEGFYDNSASVF